MNANIIGLTHIENFITLEKCGAIVDAIEADNVQWEDLPILSRAGFSTRVPHFSGIRLNRHVKYYGWAYNAATRQMHETAPIPPIFLELIAEEKWDVDCVQYSHWNKSVWQPRTQLGLEFAESFYILALGDVEYMWWNSETYEKCTFAAKKGDLFIIEGPARHIWQHGIAATEHGYSCVYFKKTNGNVDFPDHAKYFH